MRRSKINHTDGFTLIEVLIALAVIAIAFTALIQSSSVSIKQTQRIKNKIISHWIMQQGITMFQLSLVQAQVDSTQVTTMLDQSWYWRPTVTATRVPGVQQVQIKASLLQSGPFDESLSGYLYAP